MNDGPTPMFPLGSVLLPGMLLPLRVFEPRYRAMLDDLDAAGSRTFGVVLIERGSEVGGGDERADIGCLAEIVQIERAEDGSAQLQAVGTEVVKVTEWLPDDPYPRAVLRPAPRPEPAQDSLAALEAVFAAAQRSAEHVVHMAFEMGLTTMHGLPELDDDAWRRVDQLAMLLPLGPLDRQRILAADDVVAAAEALRSMAVEQELILRARYEQRG